MLENILAVIQHITGSMGHNFLEFTRIARDKEALGLGIRQYKTEKWLQAELATRLRWTGCYGAVAEVGQGPQVDLVVWSVEDTNRRVSVMLKCWQNSAQNAEAEADVLRRDVEWALAQGYRVAVALLPDEVERPGYTHTVLGAQPEKPTDQWEVPFQDIGAEPRRVRIFCWYKA